ncbi:hypothetical protein JRO89_XS15G0154300 [Xanthoceras sorbifolium]|uniref:Glycosyltransferase n=1 Tax=Xanthoceras sorbifolium TaxID=99658 RepID=A0ABQ8H2D8_9ROSI|nr:hypothetical protein JRO89_XS15G0154300 [Xanthoceras sorbifolium]
MGNPHVLVLPLPAQGHVIPAMELAQCLAKHGIKITVANPDFIHNLVVKALETKADTGNSIRLVSFPVDGFEDIFMSMPRKVKEFIEQVNTSSSDSHDDDKITCVVADDVLAWAMEIAAELGIKRVSFCSFAATLLASVSSIPKLIEDGIIGHDGTPTKEQMVQLSPSMPAMNTSDLLWVRRGIWEYENVFFEYALRKNKSMNLADWVLCNSAYCLEPAAFGLNPKILPIGPILASNRSENSTGSFWPEDMTCLKWLDQQATKSVIYVAFGSITLFDQTQFNEFAMALELSNRPFLWVLRPDIADKLDNACIKGFQARVGARGRIISWAPQQKVLEHPSIACFLSHCGWNSTVESLSNGVPLLCWPFVGDQFHNENYICNFWKVGLGFKRDDERGIITREEIKSRVEELLGNEMYKTNAVNLKKQVVSSIKEGGSSYNNFKSFVEWLEV